MFSRILIVTFALAMATAFTYTEVATAKVVTDGLVSYWTLDEADMDGETVKDVWGDNHGTINGNPKIVEGKIGQALEFDGDDSVDIQGMDSLDFNDRKELTATAWVKVQGPGIGGCCPPIVAQREVDGWALRLDGRNVGAEVEFIIHNAAGSWIGDGADFGAPVEEGEWRFLTGVLNTDQLLIYVDSELVNTIAFSGVIASGGTAAEIGGAPHGGYFEGLIDDVRIYEKALSEEEVRQNMESEGLGVSSKAALTIIWGRIKVQ